MGVLVLRNDGYQVSANPILTVTGLGSLLMAPFGAATSSTWPPSAAICTGKDAHADRRNAVAGLACAATSSSSMSTS